MLRVLNQNELENVSGGADIIDVYPPTVPGYVLVGWSEKIVGWDTYTWTEDLGLFTRIEHIQQMPIYDIQPLYTPIYYY